MICPKCGAQNMDGVSFCGSCGASMASNVPFTPYVPQPNVYQPHVPLIAPKNWMTEAILVTVITFLCCCSPISLVLGIIAIIKANSVNDLFSRGIYDEANSNAEMAKKLTMWAGIVAAVYVVLFTVFYWLFLDAIINEAGGLEDLLNSMKEG